MRILEDIQTYFGGAGSISKNGQYTLKSRTYIRDRFRFHFHSENHAIRSFSTTSFLNTNNKNPVVIYPNSDYQKLDILRDNKNKSGIYR